MSSPVKDLYEFLVAAELQQYYNSFRSDLKVTTIPQLKYVDDEDLIEMGMSKPEIRRLKKFFKKECPQGALGKIKRVSSISIVYMHFLSQMIFVGERTADIVLLIITIV